MDNSSILDEWLSLANDDLRIAKHLLLLYPMPLESICYHCEQSAEKYLKAYLVANGVFPPKTHDLIGICGLCIERNASFVALKSDCSDLTQYSTRVRYPSEIDVEKGDVERSITEAEHIAGFVMEKLKSVDSKRSPLRGL